MLQAKLGTMGLCSICTCLQVISLKCCSMCCLLVIIISHVMSLILISSFSQKKKAHTVKRSDNIGNASLVQTCQKTNCIVCFFCCKADDLLVYTMSPLRSSCLLPLFAFLNFACCVRKHTNQSVLYRIFKNNVKVTEQKG